MASKQKIIDFLLEQTADAGDVTVRKMFGEYAIYCEGKVVALVCDDQLFIKPTQGGRDYISDVEQAPPYKGAKLYFLIAGDQWEDADWLTELIKITAKELPLPKPKKPKKSIHFPAKDFISS